MTNQLASHAAKVAPCAHFNPASAVVLRRAAPTAPNLEHPS
jgi:hypothetical protein